MRHHDLTNRLPGRAGWLGRLVFALVFILILAIILLICHLDTLSFILVQSGPRLHQDGTLKTVASTRFRSTGALL